jgi:hypothetical protein
MTVVKKPFKIHPDADVDMISPGGESVFICTDRAASSRLQPTVIEVKVPAHTDCLYFIAHGSKLDVFGKHCSPRVTKMITWLWRHRVPFKIGLIDTNGVIIARLLLPDEPLIIMRFFDAFPEK